MKNRFVIGIVVCVFFIVVATVVHFKSTVSKQTQEKLYSAIENIILQENSTYTNLNDYMTFISTKRLGAKAKGNTTYVYVWIQAESFFRNSEQKVESYQGSSIPYRFIFENGEYVKYDTPEDGEEFSKSIKKIFPLSVRLKFNSIYSDDYLKQNILKQVEDYYGILADEIYY